VSNDEPERDRKITLKNGLQVTARRLYESRLERPRRAHKGRLEHLRRAYIRHLSRSFEEDEARKAMSPCEYDDFYAVTFHFREARLHALANQRLIEDIMRTLNSETPEDALDRCMCLFLGSKLVYSTTSEHDDWGNINLVYADPETAKDPRVQTLKKAIKNNISPSAAVLVYLEDDE
jgi:3-hydroxy-3-methylglutaryl CoA synthase